MSYEFKRRDCKVVVCDICLKFSYVGDRHWHAMPSSTTGAPVHLCGECRAVAVWCPAHAQYHLPTTLHRHACEDCGGLFTSVVRDRQTRCPACRRSAGVQPPVRPEPPARSWVRALFAPRTAQQR